MTDNVIKIGDYVVIQKQSYKKLHKLNKPNSNVNLGRHSITLTGIDGCPYFSVFKMIPNGKRGNQFRLELADETVDLSEEIDIKSSGNDNRNICDDGRSQKLSKDEIDELTNVSNKPSDIVETLISNSNTFHNKTEFSQEKYLKKKQKKYFEYLEVLKPNLRVIAEVMYKLDPDKIQNLREDTLSQMITYSNIHCDGNHLLYDSGSNGLLAAALMSAIGEKADGKLVHMHPGVMSQKQALLAMNFSEEQLKRCLSVNIYSVLRQIYQGNDINVKILSETNDIVEIDAENKDSTDISLETNLEDNCLKRKAEDDDEHKCKVPKLDNSEENSTEDNVDSNTNENGLSEPKKPGWHYDNIAAAEILTNKIDSLVIACKEDPKNVFLELLPFVKPGRPFVIYYSVAEPLQNLYVVLKSMANVAALKLTCNWMRNYQILPERTHPEVLMNAQSGYLLTGYVLE